MNAIAPVRTGSDLPLDAIAAAIVARGFAVPAIFLLELHKPLATIAATALDASRPFLQFIIGRRYSEYAARIFSSRQAIEDLIVAIEERS